MVIEFLFDFGSPTTYLAHKRLPAIIARTGATVDYVPVLLGGVFKATGNASPVSVPAKGAYMNADMGRFAAREGIVLNFNPHFPINTLQLMRIAAGLKDDARFEAYVDATFDAMWAQPVNMGDPAAAAAAFAAAGLDPAELGAIAEAQASKDRLKAATEAAVARGVFGAPTFFVDGAMYFGQDRLDWVEAAVA
ncbi:2-hydroxychromene-2-carboxylate isomerase [Glacieibacterium frigidum]|uniref:2-hydroxychromene-2-carboxylate isomerase n=1 Tax=Glacieibacterium frigidum TaxID=2593303 RepID=A0A552UGS6_9SPHN|nr:2-hydroxychromene-2-carboxylate isomerase [Glacieibacterium frigidum]TRW17443.1 2-hydroxychromene-2-carboxylate isomerase [Glacieibacterium frigidum]